MRDLPSNLKFATPESVKTLPSLAFSEKRNLPDTPGVYFVLDDDGAILYVGAAWYSLKKRWRQHNQTRRIRQGKQVRIAYLVCEDDLYRHRAEEFAIFNLQPELNVIAKKRDPLIR